MSEATIERRAVRDVWTYHGVKSVKFAPPGIVGYPDRMFWVPGGRPLFVEFKRPGEALEPVQVIRHEELKRDGYDVVTCWTSRQAVDAVERALSAAIRSRGGVHRRPADPVEAARVPEARGEVADRARVRRALLGPRAR